MSSQYDAAVTNANYRCKLGVESVVPTAASSRRDDAVVASAWLENEKNDLNEPTVYLRMYG